MILYSFKDEQILLQLVAQQAELNRKYIDAINNVDDEKKVNTLILNLNDNLEYYTKLKSELKKIKSDS